MKTALACYQFNNNKIQDNLKKLESGMKLASVKQAGLVCFGEAFLQGFDSLNWNYEHDKEIAVSQNDEIIISIAKLTIDYKVDIMFGYFEKDGQKIYSSEMLMSKGKILYNYRRISKGWKEYRITDEHYCEGKDTSSFLYHDLNCQIALCGDGFEYPQRFTNNDLLFWPVYVNYDLNKWKEYLPDYLAKASLMSKQVLLFNSLSKNPSSIGGAYYFKDNKIMDAYPFEQEGILVIEI